MIKNLNNINYNKFEDLLGKHISVAEDILGNEFDEIIDINNFKNKRYSIKSKLDDYALEIRNFFGINYRYIFIETDKNDIIESITIYFEKLIDRQFYDMFNKVYGRPTSILIIDKRTVISESWGKEDTYGFNQHLRKSELELREGTFDEGPLYIIWRKDSYEVKALIGQQNLSQITFKQID